MEVLLVALVAAVAYLIAYHTYGRWLGKKIFRLSAETVCPSVRLRDDRDYVPTRRSIVFGHHFTSIAGTGPIVGPAIAIMWGWLPALLWVLLGSIFIGAVHDFGSLVVSLRNNGQSVGDVAGRVINRRVRLLFLFILFLALTIVLAIFGLVISLVFRQFPAAIFPCLLQIPLAVGIGWLIRQGKVNLLGPSIAVLALMYISVLFGDVGWLHEFNSMLAAWPVWGWVIFLLGYCYIASILPVWALLQPRDYINALQLISALVLVVLGLMVAAFIGGAPLSDGTRPALELAAPMVQWSPVGAPALFPFLFITIACGAISGFHCLVSSGTTSKQVKCESDARFIGYGSMLLEGFLAVLVILACAAGLGLGLKGAGGEELSGAAAWMSKYGSWGAASGLGAKLGAFVHGSANFLASLGIPASAAIALMGVFVASFAGTTLDTSCRLQRFVIQELGHTLEETLPESPFRRMAGWFRGVHASTLLAVSVAFALAICPAPGKPWSLETAGTGGLILWPMFGATNQLLGGLAFLVIAFYLQRRNQPVWFLALPAIFMLGVPFWGLTTQIFFGTGDAASWLSQSNWMLIGIGLTALALEIWMLVEAFRLFPKVKGVAEMEPLPEGKTANA